MRSPFALLFICMLASACASTPPSGPTPQQSEKTGRSGALKVLVQGSASLESTDQGSATQRHFDPKQVHNQSGLRNPHIGEYFHGDASAAAFHSGHSVGFDPDWMVAHFIDVGQGDSILLEFECGAALIDTGGEDTPEVNGPKKLGAYLNTFFARRPDLSRTLDLVVLSHPHKDHTFGVTALIGNVEGVPPVTVRNVIDNGVKGGEGVRHSGVEWQDGLRNYATSANAQYQQVRSSDIKYLDGLTSTTIDPINCAGVNPVFRAVWGRDSDSWNSNANNHSVVIRLDFGESSFLFMGDAQMEALSAILESYAQDLSIMDVDVLKVGRHGSNTATTPAFLQAVTPEIAVIQAGDSGLSEAEQSAYSYGLPSQRTLDILTNKEFGVSRDRAPIIVNVGVKARNPKTGELPVFSSMTLDRAVYAVAWDGMVIVEAKKDGTMRVLTSK